MNIYQEEILEHYHDPHNFGALENPTHHNCSLNPTCGDKLCMDIVIAGERIEKINFSGEGCAISQAAGSMLTHAVHGKDIQFLMDFSKDDMLTLLGVELSPNRMKCGLLALESAHKAMNSGSTSSDAKN